MRLKTYVLSIFVMCIFISSNVFAKNVITTLVPNKLTVAVTDICKENTLHNSCWIYQMLNKFAHQHQLQLAFKIVNFDKSWELAAQDQVDVVATGVSVLPERVKSGATFSEPYAIVKRGIRIQKADKGRFKTINDFIGFSVGTVKGMTAESDLRHRAPKGVTIVVVDTWEELYDLFNKGKIQGIAEGFYVFETAKGDINEGDDGLTVMIDAHDLEPGKKEGLAFVVRNQSKNLLQYLNAFIKSWQPTAIKK